MCKKKVMERYLESTKRYKANGPRCLLFPCVSMPLCIKATVAYDLYKGKEKYRQIGIAASILHCPCPLNQPPFLLLIREADIHLNPPRRTMPSPLRQLSLIIKLLLRDLPQIPTAVFIPTEQSRPEAFEVMARLRVNALHLAQEEIP